MNRKSRKFDPVLQQRQAELAEVEMALGRWWGKLVRAFNRYRKLLSKAAWLARKVRERQAELDQANQSAKGVLS
jgi:hypothetical protein